MKTTLTIIAFTITFAACQSGKQAVQMPETTTPEAPIFTPGPQAVVYKTTKDYYKQVPVQMNESRTEIVSYPAPTDVYFRGELAYPTRLSDGYLLDNRGIGVNTVFLDYTYEEYSKLTETPSRTQLMEHIVDKYPLSEIWHCGLRSHYTNEVNQLNLRIKNHFKNCRSILKKLTVNPVN